jgi:uncharacterized Rmd1/YagE family protein
LCQTTILCYKITTKPDMHRIANYFGMKTSKTNLKVIIFHSEQLEAILQVEMRHKAAFCFDFGCICLINFEETEAYRFVNILASTGVPIDYKRFFAYVEKETLTLAEDIPEEEACAKLGIHSAALAKSVELKHLEESVSLLFDKAEQILNDLQRGFPNPFSRLVRDTTFGIIRSQMGVINSLRILDRPKEFGDSLEMRAEYEAASKEHGLEKRFLAIQMKLNDLMTLISPYRKLGYSQKERLLLLIEIILIMLFPLAYLIE